MARADLEKSYSDIVSELADMARLCEGSLGEKIDQAIDDGFIYTDDEAVVLAWALEIGLVKWGESIDWLEIMDNLRADIAEGLNER